MNDIDIVFQVQDVFIELFLLRLLMFDKTNYKTNNLPYLEGFYCANIYAYLAL